MKKLNLFLYSVVFLFLCGSIAHGQSIVKVSAEHKVSGKAGKPGALIDFVIDKDKSEISIKYLTKENKRKIEYETYTYDLGTLKEKGVEETEIEKERAFKLFRRYRGDNVMRFVRVKNNMAQQIVLERGYRETTVGNDWATTRFVTEQKEKFKDPQNRKQTMVAYRSDAASYNLGLNTFGDAFASQTGHTASGNALIMTMVKPKRFQQGEFAPGTKYSTMLIASKDFSILSENSIKFEFPHYPVSGINLPDGGMAIVYIPMNKGALAGYSIHMAGASVKSDLNEWVLLTIDGKGNETGRYPFKVEHQHANMNLGITQNGDYLVYGFADELKVEPTDDKHPNYYPELSKPLEALIENGIRIGNPKTFELVKITKAGETIFSTSTPLMKTLETLASYSEEKVKTPKVNKWDKHFKKDVKEGSVFEVNDHVFMQFIDGDNYQLAQFNKEGKFDISYFTEKEGDKFVESQIVVAPNNNVYWMNFEHDEGKADEMWMKAAKIDPAGRKLEAIQIPGDQKYYVMGDMSFASAEGLSEVILYLQNGKKIYLGKLPVE